MKIAMMTAWNTDSGVAIHAEPIGKAWLEMGHDLQIFTFLKDDYHGEEITAEDEPFVTRCFGTSTGTNFLDPRPILMADYDFFVIQDLGMLPKDKLVKIFPVIKRKAKTIHIVHDNAPSPDPAFYQHDWDAVVYFDPRQEGFLKRIYGERAHYIPFPCFPRRRGDKAEARRRLGLSLDKKIVVVFCRRGYQPYLPQLPDPDLKDVLFLVLTNRDLEADWPQTEVRREEFFPHSLFDEYLFAADALILHKMSTAPQEIGILSSTAYQCLGTGCPILAPRLSDFVWPFDREVLKYGDRRELKELLLDVFAEGERYRESQKAAEWFVEKHSPEKVAQQFIELFESLKGVSGAFAFDRDGTLEWGDPPGPITREHLERTRALGYAIGGSGGQPPEEQMRNWHENGIDPDFVVYKGSLPSLAGRFMELTHIGDTEDDLNWARKARARYMSPEEFVAWLEGRKS